MFLESSQAAAPLTTVPRVGLRAFSVLSVALWLAAVICAHAQTTSPTAIDTYLALLERYASGDQLAAADAAAAMDPEQSRRVLMAALDEVSGPLRNRRALLGTGEILRLRRGQLLLLVRSTLLLTDAAVRSPASTMPLRVELARDCIDALLEVEDRSGGPLPIAPEPGVLLAPPPQDVQGRPWLADATWPALRTFVWQWYRAVTSLLQAADFHLHLRGHVDEGLKRFSDDPDLLLARGTLRESEAELRIIDPSLAKTIYTDQHRDRTRAMLLAAAAAFQDALEQDAALYEASLRLGRVRHRLGHHDRAATALAAAAADKAPLLVRYLAALFTGGLAEDRDDAAAAERSYAQALTLLPDAQAPMLSLSRLCDARGDTPCARTWLLRSMSAVKPTREDYWWTYRRGQTWRLEERFTELRRQGLQ